MFRFSGDECQYCKQKLNENDDIVVCPDCGAPYHRDCYNKSGVCVRVDLHTNGEAYKSSDTESNENVLIPCPRCGEYNDENSHFCKNCGFVLRQGGPSFRGVIIDSPYMYDEEQEIEDGVTAGDLAKYIGQNSGYFISKYKKMKDRGLPISFNFSAMFFNYMYLIYRKSFVFGIIIMLVLGVLNLPSTFVSLSSVVGTATIPGFAFLTSDFVERMASISIYTDTLSWLIRITIAVFFNWFYMKAVIKKVKNLKNLYGSDFESVAQKSGGVLGRKIILILFAVYFGIILFSELSILLF